MLIAQTTCNLSLAPGLFEDWRRCINRTTKSELSSGSVLELKGLHQWTYSYSELLSSHWLHPRLDSVIINDNDWWQNLHNNPSLTIYPLREKNTFSIVSWVFRLWFMYLIIEDHSSVYLLTLVFPVGVLTLAIISSLGRK